MRIRLTMNNLVLLDEWANDYNCKNEKQILA